MIVLRMALCAWCQSVFAVKRPTHRYCSASCHLKHRNSNPENQRAAGRLGGAVRGEQRRAERQTDWYLKADGKHAHRTVAETVLGRPLEPGEIVHHEDLNKLNNDPANLIVFPSQADHARHHKLNHLGKPCACPGIRLKEVMPDATPRLSEDRC